MGLLTRGRFGVLKLVALRQRPRNKRFAQVMSANDTGPGRIGEFKSANNSPIRSYRYTITIFPLPYKNVLK
jgi:hypothetical protein